jgi:hypothetical protein
MDSLVRNAASLITLTMLSWGAFTAGECLLELPKAFSTLNWAPASGVITVSGWRKVPARWYKPKFKWVVQYRYCIEEKCFLGNNIDSRGSIMGYSPEDFQAEVNAYPENKPVTVYYNPAYPKESIMVSGFRPYFWLIFSSAVLSFALGIKAIFFFTNKKWF